MRGAYFVLLLSLYLINLAFAEKCTIINGEQCCGLVVVGFGPDITQTFAQQQGFLAEEGVNLCFIVSHSSVEIYDTILAGGEAEMVASQVDNAMWRRLNHSTQLSVVAGNDGNRGFWLVGNTNVLKGYNLPLALQGQNIVVDSVDSGFVVGLRKTLYDYDITNYSFVAYGNNRLGVVVDGELNGVPIAATMDNQIAPYLLSYPAVALTSQQEHYCPAQGTGYIVQSAWLANDTNRDTLKRYFRALIKTYNWMIDPANQPAINPYIASSVGITDPNLIQLVYDDYFRNPATGLNPYLTPRKAGLRNGVSTRIFLGLSPYPPEGVEGFITSKPGGFVDLRPLLEAQESLGVPNTYDTDNGLEGCPTKNSGTYMVAPPQLTCSAYYQIDSQPPSWPTGLSATLTVYVNNASLLLVNGAPGWQITFTAKGNGHTGPFTITSSWNNGGVTSSTANGETTYTITNAGFNAQNPSNIGWNAATTLPAPYNNICGIAINGVECAVSSGSTASTSC